LQSQLIANPFATFSGEAVYMSEDFRKLAEEHFPTQKMAEAMNRKAGLRTPEQKQRRREDVRSARFLHAIKLFRLFLGNYCNFFISRVHL
jgi:tryptophanase